MSIELIKSMLRYDPATGDLYWTDIQTKAFRGKKAGTLDGHGYINLSIKRKRYKAHRVAWLLTYGTWPNGEIDHIDGDKLNNRIENLRGCNKSENGMNRAGSYGKTSARNVYQRGKKFQVHLKRNGRPIYIGTFETLEAANQAAEAARLQFFGEFA